MLVRRCDAMRSDIVFQQLRAVVEDEVVPGKERRALSHHTTQACRPKELREEAPLLSLSAAGFDSVEERMPGVGSEGGFVARIRGQHFVRSGDNLAVGYESSVCRSSREAQRVAALDYLCLLLGAAPNDIRLAPKCFKRGDESVSLIREAAQGTLAARSALHSSHFDPWEWAVGRAPPTVPPPGLYPPPPLPRMQNAQYAKDSALREEDVVSELLLWTQPPGGFQANRLPTWQREFLAKNIAMGTLWKLLARHPQNFVIDQAAGRWWVVDARATPGLPSSAVAPPATGPVASVSAATAQAGPAASQPQQPTPASAGAADGTGLESGQGASSYWQDGDNWWHSGGRWWNEWGWGGSQRDSEWQSQDARDQKWQ